jgi:transcriptional regulator with XRE-family HTH domain
MAPEPQNRPDLEQRLHRIGRQIKALRRRKGLSQKALAELVGRSEEWLRQIESGERPVRKLDSILILADALGVRDLAELTGQLFSSSRDGRPKHQAEVQIRQAFTTNIITWDLKPDPRISAASLDDRNRDAWSAWHSSRRQYTALGILLPDIVNDAVRFQRTCAATERRDAWLVLSQAYHLVQRFMYCVGDAELAAQAADRALVSAREGESPRLVGMSAWTACMTSLLADEPERAVDIAVSASNELRPHLNQDHCEDLSVLGGLQLFASFGLARLRSRADAWFFWDKAEESALLLPRQYNDQGTMFGQLNVRLYAVAVDVETGNARHAVDRATGIDVASIPSSNRRATHYIDLARGHLARNDRCSAIGALLASEAESFETGKFHPGARATVSDLLNSERGQPDPALHSLAGRWAVSP